MRIRDFVAISGAQNQHRGDFAASQRRGAALLRECHQRFALFSRPHRSKTRGVKWNLTTTDRYFGHALPNILCSRGVFFLTTFPHLVYCPLRFGGAQFGPLAVPKYREGLPRTAPYPGSIETTRGSPFHPRRRFAGGLRRTVCGFPSGLEAGRNRRGGVSSFLRFGPGGELSLDRAVPAGESGTAVPQARTWG